MGININGGFISEGRNLQLVSKESFSGVTEKLFCSTGPFYLPSGDGDLQTPKRSKQISPWSPPHVGSAPTRSSFPPFVFSVASLSCLSGSPFSTSLPRHSVHHCLRQRRGIISSAGGTSASAVEPSTPHPPLQSIGLDFKSNHIVKLHSRQSFHLPPCNSNTICSV